MRRLRRQPSSGGTAASVAERPAAGRAPSWRGAVRSRRVWQVLRKALQSALGARWVELAHCHASPSWPPCWRARLASQSSRMRMADLKKVSLNTETKYNLEFGSEIRRSLCHTASLLFYKAYKILGKRIKPIPNSWNSYSYRNENIFL